MAEKDTKTTITPNKNAYLELRCKCGASKLEPDLVISLSSGSVREVGDVPLQSRPDEASADDWTRQTRAHQVATLVFQPAGHPWPGEVTHKLTP